LIAGVIVLVPFLIAMTLLGGSSGEKKGGPETKAEADGNPLAAARTALGKDRQPDLAVCRDALQSLNNHLSQGAESTRVEFSPEQEADLKRQYDLSDDDLREVRSGTFTSLDGHYLDRCFLFRDALRALTPPGSPTEKGEGVEAGKADAGKALDRVTRVFEWVVRQVRLQGRVGPDGGSDEETPPAFALRRGWGSPLERALVFLAVLEQTGVEEDLAVPPAQGCLLFCPSPPGPRLWACGVALAAKPDELYLFDPWLGLPLPGPGGKGIATLAQACKDDSVLGQLRLDMLNYPVTPESARQATVGVYCPLTSLAPRMRLLQDQFLREQTWKKQTLPAAVRVRLASPAGPQARLERAVAGSGGKKEAVGVWKPGTTLLRRFLPREEGGSDTGKPFLIRELQGFTTADDPAAYRLTRRTLYQFRLVPWENFPAQFRDPEKFRYDVGLGERLRSIYAGPFVRLVLENRNPREQMLRGRYTQAIPPLGSDLEQWRQMKQRSSVAEEKDRQVEQWLDRAVRAYVQGQQATTAEEKSSAQSALDQLWKEASAVELVLTGAMADPLIAELTYQSALCAHEKAEQLQSRLEAMKAPSAGEREKVREGWELAQTWWREYLGTKWPHSGRFVARRWLAETQARLGEPKKAAQTLADVSGTRIELEKLGQKLWARRLAGE
jgi:hypothetical protein